MAETSNNKFIRFLFTKEDGSPLTFAMSPCPEKTRLRPLIEVCGGQLLLGKEKSPSAINLILPTCTAKSSNLVCTTYIDDCIKEKRLLDISDYSVSVGNQYIDQMDQNKNILSMRSKSRSGRHTFNRSEDINIIKFLLDEERHTLVNGRKMWKMMESVKVVNHTWQSTKDHFLKIILPNINSYGFSSETVARFKKIGKPAKGSDGHKRAARFSLEFVGKDVVEDDEGEDVFEDVDEFDQNLFQIAKSSEKTGDTLGKSSMREDADSVEGDECNVGSKYFQSTSDVKLADKNEKRRVKALRKGKRRRAAADASDPESPSGAGQGETPDSNSATKASSIQVSSAQSTGLGLRLKSSKNVRSCETKTRSSNAMKADSTEIAVADSQNDRIEDEESDFVSQKRRAAIDSSTEPETDDKSEEVFPLVYSSRRCRRGQTEKDVMLTDSNGDSSSETNNRRSASPQPCTSKQTLQQEVTKKPKKSFDQQRRGKLRLRDFVMNDSLGENTPEDACSDINSQSMDRQCSENSLLTCDKLMTWLGLSPEVFVQAICQCNGSVDYAVKWLLSGSGKIWLPTDDMDLFSGDRAKLKVLEEKYSKDFVVDRQNYLTENLVFL